MKDLKALFDQQNQFFLHKVKSTTASERIAKLQTLRRWIYAHQRDIEAAIYKDFKKPAIEVALSDMKPVLKEIDHICGHLKSWLKPKKVPPPLAYLGTNSKIIYEPKGVALILAPWNFPFMLTVGPLVSAIAAGCCAIVKPSEMTPNTSDLIRNMAQELFDEREIAICLGDYTVAQALLKLPFHHIFFTGSPQVGKKVMAAAAETLASVTLELGGCNPCIVDETADVEDAAQKLIWGKFFNCGQSCLSINYILAHTSVHAALIKALRRNFAKMYAADAGQMAANGDFARVVNARHLARVCDLIDRTLSAGAEVVLGNDRNQADNYLSPTILNNVPPDAPIVREEIFGPVLPITTYDRLDDALTRINAEEKPLALYIFSRSKMNIEKTIGTTSSGSVGINETTIMFAHPHLPFGGVNYSGIGKAHGYSGFLAFTNERSILQQRVGFTTLKLLYAPYNRLTQQVANFVFKYL